LHNLSESWGEGTSDTGSPGGLGAPATANDATWLDRFFGATLWTNPGGTFNGTASGSQTVDAPGFYSWSSAGMIADVQAWVNTPSSNAGWLLRGQENGIHQAKRFDTKENITPANRPSLAITYTLPYGLADKNNDVGGSAPATGNQILNFGGAPAATNPAAGVRTLAQYFLNVSYNTVNNNNGSGVNHPLTLRGIYTNTATSASETISFNNVNVKCGATTSQLSAIENVAGSTAASNTISIINNTITTQYTTATSGATIGILNSATPATL